MRATYNFTGKNALVTGGTEGIGLATARRMVVSGARVFVAGRDAVRGARALAALGERAEFIAGDMGSLDAIDALFAALKSRVARLDFAVNNAAASFPLVRTAEIPLESVHESIAVNLTGVWRCMQHEIGWMQACGGGAIVNVSSVNGYAASAKAAIYSATKHGLNGMSAAAAREYIGEGIRINTVCPGAIDTPRFERRQVGKTPEQLEAYLNELNQRIPAGRPGHAEEVAAAIAWLCSDEASYIVGHDLVVDGGLSA